MKTLVVVVALLFMPLIAFALEVEKVTDTSYNVIETTKKATTLADVDNAIAGLQSQIQSVIDLKARDIAERDVRIAELNAQITKLQDEKKAAVTAGITAVAVVVVPIE